MILDANLLLDGNTSSPITGVAITTASGNTQASTNIVDLLNARDIGIGAGAPACKLLCLVTTAFTSTGSGTLNVMFQGSTDSTTWVTYAESGAIGKASLSAGVKIFNIDVPSVLPDNGPLPRYLRTAYAVGTATFSAGALISAIVLGRDDYKAYPPGVTISN